MSAYAMMSESVNGVHKVVLRREQKNKIIVSTENKLNDDQMHDLYWVVLLMCTTGLRLKDLFKEAT